MSLERPALKINAAEHAQGKLFTSINGVPDMFSHSFLCVRRVARLDRVENLPVFLAGLA
jgi:hypothetical protein